MEEKQRFESWAILELRGPRLGGYVVECELAGHGMLRIDIPTEFGAMTQYYPPSSLYALSPTTEELARAVAMRERPEPIHVFELPPPKHHGPLEQQDKCPNCGGDLFLNDVGNVACHGMFGHEMGGCGPMDAAQMAALRWKGLTKEERSEIGRKAALARWAKPRKTKKNTRNETATEDDQSGNEPA